jgi:hypothetical protein
VKDEGNGEQIYLDTFNRVSCEFESVDSLGFSYFVYQYQKYQGMIKLIAYGEETVLNLNIWDGNVLVYSCSTSLYYTDFTVTQVMVRNYIDMWESPLNGSTTMLAHVRRREWIFHLLGKSYYFN